MLRRPHHRHPRRPTDRGASTVELALYMPLLLLCIFAVVQFSLAYLGDRAAQATAREVARVARVGGGSAQALVDARARGAVYAATVGRGVLLNPQVEVVAVGPDQVRATVVGTAVQIAPGLRMPRIIQTVQGPVEVFRPDAP